MLAHKKSISLLLCVAMLLSMFATVPVVHASQAVAPHSPTNDVYSVGPDVYTVDDDVYIVDDDVAVYDVRNDIPDGIYLCDAEFIPYCDPNGSPLSFDSLHEAIHAAQAIMIAVHDKRNDGTLPGEGADEVYYIVKGDGTYYSAGDPAEPVAYTSGVEAVSTAMRFGYPAVERVGEAETAAFYAASSLGILSMVTAGDLASAIAEVQNSNYSTIVLKGSVPFDHTADCSICPSDTLWIEKNSNKTQVKIGQIEIAKDLDIIAFPGSFATVYWSNSLVDRTLWVAEGVTLTLGSNEDGAGALVFDGGAQWSGSYARFGDVLEGKSVGWQHVMPLITLEHSAQASEGNTLIVGKSVTVQNYLHGYRPTSAPSSGSGIVIDLNLNGYSGNGVISVITSDSEWTPENSPVEPAAQVHLYGRMLNNAAKQGGAVYLRGGELHIYEGAALIGNSADYGGAVCAVSDAEHKSMPSSIFMYGGEMSYNSAFDGGAVALSMGSLDGVLDAPTTETGAPPCTFIMEDGVLSYNTAHSWVVVGLEILSVIIAGETGGGAVALTAPNASFHMQGGEITWNKTLPLSIEGTDQISNFHEDGHAIAANGILPGNQTVTISGGTIANNGVDSYTGEVTGSAIEVNKDLAIYKFAVLSSLSEMLESSATSGFTSSSEIYQEIMKMSGDDTADLLEVIDTIYAFPMDDMYELLSDVEEYVDSSTELSEQEKENFKNQYAQMEALKDAGICEPDLGLTINGGSIGDGETEQVIGLGADTYIQLEKDVEPPPVIVVSPYANPGAPVIEYGGTNDSPDFELSNESTLLLHDEETDTWYVHDPNAVYTVTYKVGSKTEQVIVRAMDGDQPVIPAITLPTVAEALEKGWITTEQAAYPFSWYYNDNGTLIKYTPDQSGAMPRFVLGKDMTFVGVVDANASVTIDHNNGAGGFNIWYDLPLFSELDPTAVAELYSGVTPPDDPNPPVDPENPEVTTPRKVIAAGLTTQQITEIIPGSYSLDEYPDEYLYHTVWAVVDGKTNVVPAKVNPYPVEGESTLYILWAYDENDNDIPDFLEVTLTVDPNGGTFNGAQGQVSLAAALGTTFPRSYVETLLQGFRHSEITVHPETGDSMDIPVPVLPVGAMCVKTGTPDVPVVGKIYDIRDRETLAALQNVFYLGHATDYVVTGDETFYAIWSYDAPLGNTLGIPANPNGGSDGFADVLEVIITIDPNGGKLYLGMQDGNPVYVTGQMPMWVPKGATIPAKAAEGMSLAGLQQILVHDNGPVTYTGNTFDSPVVLVGLTEVLPTADTFFTPGKIFSALDEDKAAFAQLTDLINVWNPADGFVVTEDATYYAVWSYDITMVEMPGIVPAPDIYEALLTLYPNGGALIVGEENGQPVYSTDPMSVLIPINGIILPEYLMGISQMFAYPSGSCVLAGITADEDVLVQNIYGIENREEFFQLTGVIRADGNNDSYKVTGNTNLYAVWSKDIDGLGDPDVYQMAITLEANGGTIMGTPVTTFMYPIPMPELGSGGTQITYEVMLEMCTMLLTPPSGLVLYGLAFDAAGTQPITDTFFMAEDTTIYAIWSDRATVRIHHNDGTGDVTSWELTSQVIAPAEVAGLFGSIMPPVDPEGRPVIPAGLTTRQIEGIVGEDYELPEGVELYHSVWAVGADMISAAVNPYTVKGTDDLYVLWAYDDSPNNEGVPEQNQIPDFLEVRLQLYINAYHGESESKGTLDIGDGKIYRQFVYVIVAKGSEIPGAFFEQILSGLAHSGMPDTVDAGGNPVTVIPVLPVGMTTDSTVVNMMPYTVSSEDKAELAALTGTTLYKGMIPNDFSYPAIEDETFYAIWSYDACENTQGIPVNPGSLDQSWNIIRGSNGIPDVMEAVITYYTNGGKFLDSATEYAQLWWPIGAVVPAADMAQIPNMLITHDADVNGYPVHLVGLTKTEPAADTDFTPGKIFVKEDASIVENLPDTVYLWQDVEDFEITGDDTYYAVWAVDADDSGEPDIYDTDPQPTTSVTITWGNLTFNYSEGAWNPETHTYGQHTITPSDPNGNWISVTNDGEGHVTASFAYKAAVGYEGLAGTFVLGDATDPREEFIADDIPAGQTRTVRVWLDGSLTDPEAGTYTCGRCIVTITAIESTVQHFYLGEIGATGVDSDGDGDINYYTIDAIADLPQNVEIPGSINGIPVEEVTKLYSGDGTDGKLNQTVQSISLGEGIKIIRSQALAATPNLATVSLPSTLTTIEGNAFALNGQEKGKVIAMAYNGTKEKWDALDKADDWAKALKAGTTITCTDGMYFLESANGNNFNWSWTPNN